MLLVLNIILRKINETFHPKAFNLTGNAFPFTSRHDEPFTARWTESLTMHKAETIDRTSDYPHKRAYIVGRQK